MTRSLAALLALLLPATAMAQSTVTPSGDLLPPSANQSEAEDVAPALLVADTLLITPDNELVAEGNVEVLFEGQKLRAKKIIYSEETDSLRLIGPLRVEQPDGTVITAVEGELDAGLENGLLTGARLVLDQQLQLAAVQLARTEGRYSALSKAAVTSCQICGENGKPLWEIRARRIIHDDEEKQIFLDGATLRVVDVPVFYIPRLRFPDPSLKRARGFLFPTIRSTSNLGFGIKVPYFIPIGDHKDITLTPYVSKETTTLEARYRQAFRKGTITFDGAISRDTLQPDETRAYLFGSGSFALPRDFTLSFDVELVSDDTYLREYDYATKSRLDSAISVRRYSRDELSEARLTHYETLRENENNATSPSLVLDVTHAQRHFPKLGGELRLGAELHGHFRNSDLDVAGRDVARATASALWRRDWLHHSGLVTEVRGGLDIDAVRVVGDSVNAAEDSSVAPNIAVRLRMPYVGTDLTGARYTLEPLAQLSWTGGDALETGSDETQRSEFDEGNLLALSRFTAADRRERGWQAAAGIRWAMQEPTGWRLGLTVGRVIREESRSEFSTTSGLSQATSDWLIASRVSNGTGLDFIGRVLADDDFDIHRAEARGTWSNKKLDLSASYLLLPEDSDEARDDLVSEWSLGASYRLSRHWTASGSWQYNLVDDRSSEGAVGLEYQNECVLVRFEADRDFSDSDNLDPTTSYQLNVELKGFSTGGSAGGYRRTCSN